MKAYNQENIPLARTSRKNMTPWERKLWYDFLRNYPVRVQRQKAIGNYIADFYCAKAGLILELDGGVCEYVDRLVKDPSFLRGSHRKRLQGERALWYTDIDVRKRS